MKVDKLTVGKVFDTTERLEAPLFQRPYVWDEERNWTPLWEAMRSLADRHLADVRPRPHFLGAIVLDQIPTGMGRIHVRQIIDGQQRLTTLQVFLAALRDVCVGLKQDRYSQAVRRLIDNDVPLSTDPDDAFKVWPTNADRDEFKKVIGSGDPAAVRRIADEDAGSLIAHAYLYFFEQLTSWVNASTSSNVVKYLDALYGVVRDEILLVVIDLDQQDDAQEIFETLNALGTPLLTADLVKNYLFRLAERGKEDAARLYKWHWQEFDSEKGYWRNEVRQGRLKRPRIDAFLHYYLTLQTKQDINASQLFSTFKDFVGESNGSTAGKQLAAFRAYADVYKSFDTFPPDSPQELFFYKLDALDISTAHPLLLEVFKRFNNAEHRGQLEQILTDLEGYFIRRAVCELTTKNYNKLFVDLLKGCSQNDDYSSDQIRRFLLAESAEATRWPDDAEFGKAWRECRMYKRLKRSKLRVILESLEHFMRTAKTEAIKIPRQLTIEHLMPRDWERQWPLTPRPGMTLDEAGNERDDLINTIGNLTLLTRELNPSVSNGAWLRKRTEILKHSALNLNRLLPEEWNEDFIRARTEELGVQAVKLWGRPAESVFALAGAGS